MNKKCHDPTDAFLPKAMWECESCQHNEACKYANLSLKELVAIKKTSAKENARQTLAGIRSGLSSTANTVGYIGAAYYLLKLLSTSDATKATDMECLTFFMGLISITRSQATD